MKQITKIPRRVGTSLLEATNFYANKIISAMAFSNDEYRQHAYRDASVNAARKTNLKLVSTAMVDACNNIRDFHKELDTHMDNETPIPEGAFISVAKHKKAQLKYVVTDTSVGLVITTAMLKEMLVLATSMTGDVVTDPTDSTVNIPLALCESTSYDRNKLEGMYFIRIADVIRYFDEVDGGLIEISLEGYENDWKLKRLTNRGYYYSHGEEHQVAQSVLNPMVSDRYQHESWLHYLQTQYNGLCDINQFASQSTSIPKSVALSEIKALEA